MALLFSKMWRTGVVTEDLPAGGDETLHVARAVEERTRQLLGRSLTIREVDAGSCNGCEIEISGLNGPVYDCERFGVRFLASPRHAGCNKSFNLSYSGNDL